MYLIFRLDYIAVIYKPVQSTKLKINGNSCFGRTTFCQIIVFTVKKEDEFGTPKGFTEMKLF